MFCFLSYDIGFVSHKTDFYFFIFQVDNSEQKLPDQWENIQFLFAFLESRSVVQSLIITRVFNEVFLINSEYLRNLNHKTLIASDIIVV